MKILSGLFKTRFHFFSHQYFSQACIKMEPKIAEKYPNVISGKELNKILEACSTSQEYTCYPKDLEKKEKTQGNYPNRINPEKLSQALKEAEVTRKKFSVY